MVLGCSLQIGFIRSLSPSPLSKIFFRSKKKATVFWRFKAPWVSGEGTLLAKSSEDLQFWVIHGSYRFDGLLFKDFSRTFKVPLWRKFCIPFSLQLLKVEVINTYHAKFYIEIPTGRPVILIVKFSFVLPPLLDSKNGREPHRELDLVAPRGIWRHTRTTCPAFEWPISLKEAILVAQGPSLQRPRIVNTRKKTHGDFLDIYGSELCSKGGNFFRQIVLYVAPKH